MKEKKYKTIKEVSILLNINSHVIRYWDSKFDDLSIRFNSKKQRYFNSENINKIKQIKETLYSNGKHNYTLDLVNKLSKTKINKKNNNKILSSEIKEKKDNFIIDELLKIRKNLYDLIN